MLDEVDEQIERIGSQRDGCPSRTRRLGRIEPNMASSLEALQHVRIAAEHELEGADLLRLIRQGHSQRHAFAVRGPRVDRGMLIGRLPVTNRTTVLAHEGARHVEGAFSIHWNRCLHRAMRAIELECAVSRIEDQPDVVAAPLALRHEPARATHATTARQQ
jgi:hypothetical protein